MSRFRPRPRSLWVALLAIAGMVSVADVASACTTKVAPAPRACCAERAPSDCGCCVPGRPLPSSPAVAARFEAIASSPDGVLHQAPASSCECRASEPAAPSERPAQRTSTERSEVRGLGSSAAVLPADRPSPPLGRLLLANESPPRSPLYLRTSRLLI